MNINKQGSTVQNSTRKHAKQEEKFKLDKEAHQQAKHETQLLLGTNHVLDGGEITSLAVNNFASEEFFGGWGQICNDEYTSKNSKNVDFDRIMKAFFDERNNLPQHKWFTNANECFQRTAEMSLEIANLGPCKCQNEIANLGPCKCQKSKCVH